MNLQRAVYETKAEKTKDFFIGVGLFIGLNVVLTGVIILLSYLASKVTTDLNVDILDTVTALIGIVLYCLPLLLNLGVMIYFGLTRYWIALGMLGTFAALLLLTVIAGVVLTIWCFVALSNSGL